MMLSQLLSLILAQTSLTVEVPEGKDVQLDSPESLFSIDLHHSIGDIVADACRRAGLSVRGSAGFGEFVAELATGWATRYSNERVLFDVCVLSNFLSNLSRYRIDRFPLAAQLSVRFEPLPH